MSILRQDYQELKSLLNYTLKEYTKGKFYIIRFGWRNYLSKDPEDLKKFQSVL